MLFGVHCVLEGYGSREVDGRSEWMEGDGKAMQEVDRSGWKKMEGDAKSCWKVMQKWMEGDAKVDGSCWKLLEGLWKVMEGDTRS